jgi:rare lipoprotein A (peptidoglycan hydrolase)
MFQQTVQCFDASLNGEKYNSIFGSDQMPWEKMIRANGTLCYSRWFLKVLPVILISTLVFAGCTSEHSGGQGKLTQQGKEGDTTKPLHKEVGEASWYGPGFQGQETANGETFNQNDMTAAHPSLPMGTKAKVTNLENGKKVQVTINDRGPFAENRVIDLSRAAAKKLDMVGDGTTKVKIETKPIKKKVSAKSSRKTKKGAKKSASSK